MSRLCTLKWDQLVYCNLRGVSAIECAHIYADVESFCKGGTSQGCRSVLLTVSAASVNMQQKSVAGLHPTGTPPSQHLNSASYFINGTRAAVWSSFRSRLRFPMLNLLPPGPRQNPSLGLPPAIEKGAALVSRWRRGLERGRCRPAFHEIARLHHRLA